VPLSVGGAGSPSNTMSTGLRHTAIPSGILIHPSVCPQYTNVTDRQTDNCAIAYGEAFYERSPKKYSGPTHFCIVCYNDFVLATSFTRPSVRLMSAIFDHKAESDKPLRYGRRGALGRDLSAHGSTAGDRAVRSRSGVFTNDNR